MSNSEFWSDGSTPVNGSSDSAAEESHELLPYAEQQSQQEPASQLGFAQVGYLRPWLPDIDPSHPKANGWKRRLFRQLRLILAQTILVGIVLTINVTITVWAIYKRANAIKSGVGVLERGSCSKIRNSNIGLHVVNILSTVVLASSNYCMQILVSPTRNEVDRP